MISWSSFGRLRSMSNGMKTRLLLAGSLLLGVALAIITWKAGGLDVTTFAGLQDSVTAAPGSATSAVAIGAAFVIGAAMIVLPCGYPSVFVVPSILQSRRGFSQRVVLSLLFLAGSALLLAAVGVAFSFAGAGILELLSGERSKLAYAAVLYSVLGVLAIAYALSEVGILRMPTPQARVSGPNLPQLERPYARSLMLGATFGGGMGIACPMPTYYVILGWVAAAASPLYGAVLMAAYGLGRVVPALGIGVLLSAGANRALLSRRMALLRERTGLGTALLLAAFGAYVIVLFGGVVGSRAL